MSKEFYIPTSTLNFANILSTESISPKAFYGKRLFGIKRWHDVPLNDSDNYISLYSELPNFDCPPNELEDHPLVLELTLNEEQEKKHLQKYGEGFYVCDHTLYFNPINIRFIFYSVQHERIAISLAEQLLETKTLHLYRKRFDVRNPSNKSYPGHVSVGVELNQKEIDEDSKINKLKGLLYGYYIGAIFSCAEESVKKLSILRQIQNVISAIVSNENRIPTHLQEELLRELLDRLSPIKNEFDSLGLDKSTADKVSTYINRYYQVKSHFDVPSASQIISDLQTINKIKNEPESVRWITNQISKVEYSMTKNQVLDPERSEIVVVEKLLSSIKVLDGLEKRLFEHWVNGLLLNKYYEGSCSVYQSDLAYDLTVSAKEMIGAKWDSSSIKNILNGIRHIVAGDSFEIEYDNGVFSSVAAVVLKSDSWEQMLRFMQEKGMYDYRLAFALYGELKGFANLYSTFTDNLFQKEPTIVWKVYREFYGQLFNERIVQHQENSIRETSLLDTNEFNTTQTLQSNQEKQPLLPPSIQNLLSDSEFAKLGSKHKGAKSYYENIVLEITQQFSDERVIWERINSNNNFWIGTKTEWKGLIKKHMPNGRKTSRKIIPEPQQGMFEFGVESPTFPFWCDPNAWGYIVDIVPKNARKDLKSDLDWFQNEYKKGDGSDNYARASRENRKVIDAFCRLKEDAQKYPNVQKYFPRELRKAIKEKLYSLYKENSDQ